MPNPTTYDQTQTPTDTRTPECPDGNQCCHDCEPADCWCVRHTARPSGGESWALLLQRKLAEARTEVERLNEKLEAATSIGVRLALKSERQLDALKRVRGVNRHKVIWDDYSHTYVVMSCGMRVGEVIYCDDLDAALQPEKTT